MENERSSISYPIWIGSHTDIRTGEEALKALSTHNDSQYWTKNGILTVPEERWKQAQKFEIDIWTSLPYVADDRSLEHKTGFNNYESLPQNLGDVIEHGCGPFTQSATILQNRTHKSLTLADPLASQYLTLPNCAYKDGILAGIPVTVLAQKSEEIVRVTEQDRYDTVICINVLEHVQNVKLVLDNLYHCMRIGGNIVFHERNWDHININELFDVGHPIRVSKAVLDDFKRWFVPLYDNGDYFIGKK